MEISYKCIPDGPIDNKSALIDSGNGLVPSDNKQVYSWTNLQLALHFGQRGFQWALRYVVKEKRVGK